MGCGDDSLIFHGRYTPDSCRSMYRAIRSDQEKVGRPLRRPTFLNEGSCFIRQPTIYVTAPDLHNSHVPRGPGST